MPRQPLRLVCATGNTHKPSNLNKGVKRNTCWENGTSKIKLNIQTIGDIFQQKSRILKIDERQDIDDNAKRQQQFLMAILWPHLAQNLRQGIVYAHHDE